MRISKCPSCKTKIQGVHSECPFCNAKFVCKCGKELDDNKYGKCPMCRAESAEKRKKVGKGILAGVAVVGTVLGAVAGIKGRNGGTDDL